MVSSKKKSPPPEIARAAWAPSIRVRAAPTARGEWKAITLGIDELEALDREHPGHEVVLHKLLNLLEDGLELLLKHPTFVPKAQREARLLGLAAACIARVPARFQADSPFGSTCTSAWTIGHRTYAAHAPSRVPSWAAHVRKLEVAAERFRNAPRTHAEGRLKSTATVKALMDAGAAAPWIDEARALYAARD